MFGELWVQPDTELGPQCLLSSFARDDRVRYQPLHQEIDKTIDQHPWVLEDTHRVRQQLRWYHRVQGRRVVVFDETRRTARR